MSVPMALARQGRGFSPRGSGRAGARSQNVPFVFARAFQVHAAGGAHHGVRVRPLLPLCARRQADHPGDQGEGRLFGPPEGGGGLARSPAHLLLSLWPQNGKLQIFELASGSLLETLDAHHGALWSLCLAPDQVALPSSLPSFRPSFTLFALLSIFLFPMFVSTHLFSSSFSFSSSFFLFSAYSFDPFSFIFFPSICHQFFKNFFVFDLFPEFSFFAFHSDISFVVLFPFPIYFVFPLFVFFPHFSFFFVSSILSLLVNNT